MSEQSDEPQHVAVQISIAAVDSDSVRDAERLRLEIEGDARIILAFTDLNVAYLQARFGDNAALLDAEGNPLPSGPKIIDPLAEGSPASE